MRGVSGYVLISVVAGALAQLVMKSGLLALSPLSALLAQPELLWEVSSLWALSRVAAGILLYLIAVLVWIKVLKVYPLSLAYPLLSLGYILVYLGSVWWPALNESLSVQKTLGVFLIIIGVIIVAQYSEEKPGRE